ncbi:MAG: hypothetical protein WAR83_05465 [Flavobacteriales bacterium]
MKIHVVGVGFNLIMTLFVLYVHVSGFTTSMIDHQTAEYNLERDLIANDYLTEEVDNRRTHPVFSNRPLVTTCIDLVSGSLNIDTGKAYVLVQFSFLFFSGLLLYYLAFSIFQKPDLAFLSTLSYYLSFTILFAFFSTNYTYDNILQQLLIFGAFLLLMKNILIVATLVFGLSMFAHESGLLLLPGLYLFLMKGTKTERFGVIAGSLIVWAVLLSLVIGTEAKIVEANETFISRFELYKVNFQNWRYTSESLFSVLLAVGVPSYLLWCYPNLIPRSMHVSWNRSYWLSLIIIIPVVMFMANARESRLFAIPLVFLWPILGPFVRQFFMDVVGGTRKFYQTQRKQLALFLVGSIVLSAFMAYAVYQQTGQLPDSNLHNEFLFVALAAVLYHYQLRRTGSILRSSRTK